MRNGLLLRVSILLTFTFLFRTIGADAVDEYLQVQMARNHLPGIAIAVTKNGTLLKLAGYGLANVEHQIPVTPETVFQIQSVTKQFVATAIMILAEEGKLSVDDKVSSYLEGTPETWKDVTVRHLLTHTSGIKDFINEPTASLRLEVTDEVVFQATVPRPLNFPPGERYAYSNSNYHLLAMIIHKVAGQPYGAFLKARVFEPLGMTQTRVVSWSEIIPHRAEGYSWRDGQFRHGQFVAESILAYGGGGLLSSAKDMAKWDLALRGAQVLKRTSLEQMWRPGRLNNGSLSQYGFGWGLGGKSAHRTVNHSGGHITGFTSHIVRYLDDDLSIIVLVNAGHGNPAKLAQGIAGIYVPELKPPERKAIEDQEPTVAELLKRIDQMVRAEALQEEVFTPAMAKVLSASLKHTSAELKASGSLQCLELLERNHISDGTRRYLYRMRLQHVALLVSLVLDQAGKVAGLDAEAE